MESFVEPEITFRLTEGRGRDGNVGLRIESKVSQLGVIDRPSKEAYNKLCVTLVVQIGAINLSNMSRDEKGAQG